ncbi:MAG: aminotransferase class V-fold PLP-dependent enzyme [Saprospiraceae bacterium]|nr:aminotransferase class V-fold PLP-dependent enzyme [Saprospiraceae bacterium]
MQAIEYLRAQTPGCENLVHLNNAGASLQPLPVLDAVHDHLELETRMGGYEAADARAGEIAGFYQAIATLLHAAPRNIAFAASATDAYAKVLSAIPWRAGDAILTTENDYASNQIAFLSLQKRLGVRLLRARDLPEGGVDVADFERLIHEHHPVLAAVTHVPTNSGLVQPIAEIGRICREHGVWYLVDACQSAGQIDLDIRQIGCDFLSATMRKYMRGPRGAGFLYVSDRALEAGLELLLPDMRSANWVAADRYETAPTAQRFEYWEMPVALLLGSKAAAEYALEQGLPAIESRVRSLAALTRTLLTEIPGVTVLDRGAQLCGIVTVHAAHWTPELVIGRLQQNGINGRISSLLAAQIDFQKKEVGWALRISPHYYNTETEIRRLAEVLQSVTRS